MLLAELVAEQLPKARLRPAQATFLAWLDLTAYDLTEDPAALLLREFGASGVRIRLTKPAAFDGADAVGVAIARGSLAA